MSSLNPKQFEQLALPGTDVPTSEPSPGPHGPAQVVRAPSTDVYQTRMLWPTSEVIDRVHKIDSPLFEGGEDPRTQWDDVTRTIEEYDPETGQFETFAKKSSPPVAEGIANRDPIPPIRIHHPYKRDISHTPERRSYDYEPELWDGHHRLREFEAAGHSEVPVYESFDRNDSGPAGGGFTGLAWWSHRPKR